MDAEIFLQNNPNNDILEDIKEYNRRCKDLLTLSIALISLNFFNIFFNNNSLLFLFSVPFFFFSFVFYLLAFLKNPSALIEEMSRDEIYAKLQQKILPESAVKDIVAIEKKVRALLFKVRNYKSNLMKIGHSSLFGQVLITFVAFGIFTYNPFILDNLYARIFFFILFVLLSVCFYFFTFKSESFPLTITRTSPASTSNAPSSQPINVHDVKKEFRMLIANHMELLVSDEENVELIFAIVNDKQEKIMLSDTVISNDLAQKLGFTIENLKEKINKSPSEKLKK